MVENNMNVLINDFDIEEVDEDDLEILNIIHFGIPRQIYKRANYFNTMNDTTFRKRFRLTKEAVQLLLIQVEEELEFPYDLNNCVSPINQILTTLRLFSTGGHLDAVADFAGMHVSTVSRIVVRVSQAIASLYQRFVSMPSDINSVRKTQQDFYNIASFPKVIGTLDCTHCKIISPGGDDPEIFRNRKGYFSINAQFVTDANLKILSVVARWPGSTHDSTIFNNSRLKRRFEENEFRGSLLLGDSGYANKTYLLTPLINPANEAERLYNESHIRTRNSVERLFGVLKRRFPILSYGCRLKIDTILTIIVASSVLHNIALTMGDDVPPPLPDELNEHILQQLIRNGQIPEVNNEAREDLIGNTRTTLINNYFRNL